MTPSVEGVRRVRVAALLAAAATTTGAATGFAAGVAWAASPLPALGGAALALVLAATVLAEVASLVRGRPVPPSVRRQVPQVWARLFAPETVAVLYGARLGVGPLTVLATWTWWGALVVGAAAGPAVGALAGATFGGARVGIMVTVGQWARQDMPGRMGWIRARERRVAVAVTVCMLAMTPLGVATLSFGG